MFRIATIALLAALLALPASAADVPPYLKLAQELGTPQLADSEGPADKSRLLLHFVRNGETSKAWTKMTTVSITKVQPNGTPDATRGVIREFRQLLEKNHAHITTFDESPIAPVTCWFNFSVNGEIEEGIVYSPTPGFVTIAQVGAHKAGVISAKDVAVLRGVIAQAKANQ